MSEKIRNYQGAIIEESEGAAKYRRWANETDDPDEREILLKMADQEEGHKHNFEHILNKKPAKTMWYKVTSLIGDINNAKNINDLSDGAKEKIIDVIDYALDSAIEQDGRDPDDYMFDGDLIIDGEFLIVGSRLIGTKTVNHYNVGMENLNIEDLEKIYKIITNDNVCKAPKRR